MNIAIHHRKGSFSERWIKYCENNKINYKIVNAYNSDIIKQVEGCTAFMWHHYSDSDYREALFAKQLLYSFEKKGLKVFPNFNTTWHFNDKVGQKYLLEAIGSAFVPTYVFYTKKEAINWVLQADFPKVFKLRGGAGSKNVRLVKSRHQGKCLVRKAFRNGFSKFNRIEYFKNKHIEWKRGKDKLGLIKGIYRLIFSSQYSKILSKEKGYVYFQDFIPDNSYDIRVIVIADKAFALKRIVRKGDFRASGGGNFVYDKEQIDKRCIKISFENNEKINSQCIAYDFVFDEDNNPLIIEISYGFAMKVYDKCQGYWTKDMKWHSGENFDFCGWMVESVIK